MSNKQKRQLAARVARQPIPLKVDGALGSVLNLAMQNDAVRIALAVLVESRGLEGSWTLQITAVRLVPVPDKAAPAEQS